MTLETVETSTKSEVQVLIDQLAAASAGDVEERGDTRERLLEAAIEAFADDGFKATTVRHLAKAVSITPGAVYAHFTSKESILSAAIARAYRRFLIDVVAPTDEDASDNGRLEGLCRRHMRFQLDNRAMAAASDALITSRTALEAANPTTVQLLRRARDLYADTIYQEVVRLSPRGAAISPLAQSQSIRALCNTIQQFADVGRFETEILINQYMTIIWRIIGRN